MSKESEESNSKFSITLKPELNKALEEEIKRKLSALYMDTFGIELKIYDVKISNGTSLYNKN